MDVERSFIRGYNPITLNVGSLGLENGLYHLFIEDDKGNSHVAKVVFSR